MDAERVIEIIIILEGKGGRRSAMNKSTNGDGGGCSITDSLDPDRVPV